MNTYQFEHNPTARWRDSLDHALKNQRCVRGIKRVFRSVDTTNRFEEFCGVFRDELSGLYRAMSDSALVWGEVAKKHRERGVYKKIAEFGDLYRDNGLLVDVACGCGYLLAELRKQHMLGLDINPFCLELAAHSLAEVGIPTNLHLGTHIEFKEGRGFVLVPDVLDRDIDISGVNLITDDMEGLDNASRIMDRIGRKADTVTFSLQGGRNALAMLEFIGELRPSGETQKRTSVQYYFNKLLGDLDKILRVGGKLVLAIRLGVLKEEAIKRLGNVGLSLEEFRTRFENENRNLKIMDFHSIALAPEETTGLYVSPFAIGPNGLAVPANPNDFTTELVLINATLKQTDIGRNEPCPCGSGGKYKKCCLPTDKK